MGIDEGIEIEEHALRSGGMRLLATAYIALPLAWLVLIGLNALWMYPAPVALALIILPTLGWLYLPLRMAYLCFTATVEKSGSIIRLAWITYGIAVLVFLWSLCITVTTGVLLARNSWDAPSPEIYETAKWASPPIIYFIAGYILFAPVLAWLATWYVKRRVKPAGYPPESREHPSP